MRTYDQIISDARTLAREYTQHKGRSNLDDLMIVSGAIHELQSVSKGIVQRDVTILTEDLDPSDGSIPKTPDYRTILDVDFYQTGSTIPIEVQIVPYGRFRQIKRDIMHGWRVLDSSCTYFVADHGYELFFYPFAGITGSFTINAIPDLPMYSTDLGNATDGYWAGWATNLADYMSTRGPEPEFDSFYESGIIPYVAARLLDKIPSARLQYQDKFREWMAMWEMTKRSIKRNTALNAIRGHSLSGVLSYGGRGTTNF